jgi:hypothetical protein
MPSSTEILALLTAMSRELAWLAALWHVALLAQVTAAFAGKVPTQQVGHLLLCAPVLSVSIASFAFGNPFNGASFALLALCIAWLARTPAQTAAPPPAWAVWLGAALLLYAWCYPAFGHGAWYRLAFTAPIGVVPCPTLASISGLTLIAGGFGSRKLPALIAAWTGFYALFGMFRLGVWLDAGLLGALGGLIASTLRRRSVDAVPARVTDHQQPAAPRW